MSEESTAPDLTPVKHSFPGTTSQNAAILGSAEERFPQKQAHVCQSWWHTHQSIALALNNIQWLRQLLSQPCGSGFWRLLISSTRALHLLVDKHYNSIESRRIKLFNADVKILKKASQEHPKVCHHEIISSSPDGNAEPRFPTHHPAFFQIVRRQAFVHEE